MSYAEWGDKLYSGEKSYKIIQKRRMWVTISLIAAVVCLAIPFVKGLNFGIDFTGGIVYQVSDAPNPDPDIAREVVAEFAPEQEPRIAILGADDIRVQIGVVEESVSRSISAALVEAYDVPTDNVSYSEVGPTFGAQVGKSAIQALIIFIGLVAVVMALYFRNWRMSVAALVALLHDLVFTVGIYALLGFEVTPAALIGFLTILGYSLYDTVVVFDKLRENTENLTSQHRFTYAEMSNLAVNQTMVRSINTSVVALLPVASILFIGSFVLGAGTLKDISLALFVGIAVGTYSSIYVAPPLEVMLSLREKVIGKHTAEVEQMRESGTVEVALNDDGSVRVGALQPGAHQGTKAQPKRKPRK